MGLPLPSAGGAARDDDGIDEDIADEGDF